MSGNSSTVSALGALRRLRFARKAAASLSSRVLGLDLGLAFALACLGLGVGILGASLMTFVMSNAAPDVKTVLAARQACVICPASVRNIAIRRRYSSGVERSLGKGEADSSILSSGTITFIIG